MKPDHIINGGIGLGGTVLASIAPEKAAAVFAGVGTGCWMFWQLCAAIYDRWQRRNSGK